MLGEKYDWKSIELLFTYAPIIVIAACVLGVLIDVVYAPTKKTLWYWRKYWKLKRTGGTDEMLAELRKAYKYYMASEEE